MTTHDAGHTSGHRHHHPDASQDPATFWEAHYADREQVWSGRVNGILEGVLAGLAPGRALDLGCGEGGDAVHLARLGWSVTAVDISATAVERTRAAAEAAGVGDRVLVERHDLAASVPAGPFDLVSAQYLQSPVSLPRSSVLQRAAESLVVGGLLVVVDHGEVPPWGQPPEGHVFASPEELLADLGPDPARFVPEVVGAAAREVVGPDGERATLSDALVVLRRVG
ncbi:methyltransferase domain-containing protein [Phycicoccus sp. HDW14]|uniref:SAM-dependent methyltransferase n=1 Tax=Phycicoccus sp. HDW14 TaxID=2714941 RepID=UPI00140C1018|nr:methyltransferase domain-containing protein [Phycicoccus sp. HDW14]QIM22492.1 methyltransferase domain-containing protein [Phycicoccus sp. HDW14]